MKSERKIFLPILITAILLLSTSVSAQNYVQAVGLRGGIYSGINYKNFVGNSTAVEVILSKPWKALLLTGLIERHQPVGRSLNFFWFYGFGAHIGSYDARYTRHSTGKYMVIGADGIIGLEYEFSRVPIALGVDWKPYFNLIGSSGFFGDGGAFSLRYTFD